MSDTPAHLPSIESNASKLQAAWSNDPRWRGIQRQYSAADVLRLRGSIAPAYTIAEHGAQRLWNSLNTTALIRALGAVTGAQAVQMVRAGLQSIYVSGWQVAADANLAAQTYPDQSLYPSNSVPALVRRLNNALARADQVERLEGKDKRNWFVPLVADAEAGFGGPLHAFELMKALIEAGAAGVHFEDQLASEKKCGHLGGKVLIPTSAFERTLSAARLASDVLSVPTILIARTDAHSAALLTSDVDSRDQAFLEGKRTSEGYFRVRAGIEPAIVRSLAYAPIADLLWFETSTPDLGEAKEFAAAVHKKFPSKLLAYNCSPSFNWKRQLDDKQIARFQDELGALGFKYQFITLAGWHQINHGMYQLAHGYNATGMSAYVKLQEEEFVAEKIGYTATKHQREAGTSYFDQVLDVITGGDSATAALAGSTEKEQF